MLCLPTGAFDPTQCSQPPVHGHPQLRLVCTSFLLQIQVAHFEPDTITLTGEGIFPRISFNLPREITSERYASLRDKAQENLSPARGLGTTVEGDETQDAAPEDITVRG